MEFIKPTEKDIKGAGATNAMSELKRLLNNMEDQSIFDVGDVIVLRRYNGKIDVVGGAPKKWVVTHIDDYGLLYANRILVSGEISPKVRCLTPDYLSNGKFESDPEQVDSILLGEEHEYDPLRSIKAVAAAKKTVKSINNKKKLKNCSREFLLKTLKKGSIIWRSHNALGEYKEKLTITSIDSFDIKFIDGRGHADRLVFGRMRQNFFIEEPIILENVS